LRMLATGALMAPSVSATSSATVPPPAMAGVGDLIAPVLSAQGSAAVSAVRMLGSGDLVVPGVATADHVDYPEWEFSPAGIVAAPAPAGRVA
jgi:hypothetical protein